MSTPNSSVCCDVKRTRWSPLALGGVVGGTQRTTVGKSIFQHEAPVTCLVQPCVPSAPSDTTAAYRGRTPWRRMAARTGQLCAAVKARTRPIDHLWAPTDERRTCREVGVNSTRLWGEGGGQVRSRASQRQGGLTTATVHHTSTTTAESTVGDAYHALKPVVAPAGPPAHVYVPPLHLTAPVAAVRVRGPRKGKAASRRPPCTPRAPPLPRARSGTLIMR